MHGRLGWFSLLLLGCSSCLSHGPHVGTSRLPPPDWIAWEMTRQEALVGTNGWTTLAGLHWLNEGRNTAGSNPTNQAVFPSGRAPEVIGTFVREGRRVRFEAAPDVVASIEGRPVRIADLQTDIENHPTWLQVGDLSIAIIERGEKLGLRVRDPQAPTRLHFPGLNYFPYNSDWRLDGRFEPFTPARTLHVPDMIGGVEEFPSPGAVVFHYHGMEYRLAVAVEPDEVDYFIMFHDLTAGKSTYPAGRFLYVHKPDPHGHVLVDFNRAYTPPCGFTAYATCPLPPRSNWLPLAVCAGELEPPGHSH